MTLPLCSLMIGLPADFIERHGRLRFACHVVERTVDRWHLRVVEPSDFATLEIHPLDERPIGNREWVLAHVLETDEWVQARLCVD